MNASQIKKWTATSYIFFVAIFLLGGCNENRNSVSENQAWVDVLKVTVGEKEGSMNIDHDGRIVVIVHWFDEDYEKWRTGPRLVSELSETDLNDLKTLVDTSNFEVLHADAISGHSRDRYNVTVIPEDADRAFYGEFPLRNSSFSSHTTELMDALEIHFQRTWENGSPLNEHDAELLETDEEWPSP